MKSINLNIKEKLYNELVYGLNIPLDYELFCMLGHELNRALERESYIGLKALLEVELEK